MKLRKQFLVFVAVVGLAGLFSASEALETSGAGGSVDKREVLSQHRVQYSEPELDTDYQSSPKFNARGMHHVYTITHLFLDLVQRKDVLPASLNLTQLLSSSSGIELTKQLNEHKSEILLQYIGVITVAVCGVLAAVAVPIAGCFVCCCRCCGKCGAYDDPYDKRGDACRRVFLGGLLSVFVVAAMFGVVAAFVTNQYAREGIVKLPDRIRYATDDTGKYFKNTGDEVHSLLVTNFEELQQVLFTILDESGDILEQNLASEIQEETLDKLTSTLDELGNVKKHFMTIQNRTQDLQEKVQQLDYGLNKSKDNLKEALRLCGNTPACNNFLRDRNIDLDLNIAAEFLDVPFQLPDLSLLMKDISDLVKVQVKVDVERSIGDIRPDIKREIQRMGVELSDKSREIQSVLNEFDGSLKVAQNDIPRHAGHLKEYSAYLYYIGFGMSVMVLLVLLCYVLGLFYGFFGSRPAHHVYAPDDCCNTGTGANWLLAAIYLTFLFSFVLLLLTTAQFLVGSTAEKVACKALTQPLGSPLFGEIDERFITPLLMDQLRHSRVEGADEIRTSMRDVIGKCHANQTLYVIMQTDRFYDVDQLRNWRRKFGFDEVIDKLSAKITGANLRDVQLLSPEAEDHLRKLANSKIADLNFSQYTELIERQITGIDLDSFIRQVEAVSRQLDRRSKVRLALQSETIFLKGMVDVVNEMRDAMFELKESVEALENGVKFDKTNFRKVINQVISQAKQSPEFYRGPELVSGLADKYVEEAVDLIDVYVERVISRTKTSIGQCHPVSLSFNATVDAVCKEIVDPFNGFWASVGWCVVLYLPSIAIAIALVSLYRKSEPYPGPLVEREDASNHVTSSGAAAAAARNSAHSGSRSASSSSSAPKNKKGKGKGGRGGAGHRRNPSEYLPDSAHHYRAGYSYQADYDANSRFQDAAPRNYSSSGGGPVTSSAAAAAPLRPASGIVNGAGGGSSDEQPPRYISNPNLAAGGGGGGSTSATVNMEYERPPPYYYPGASAPSSSGVPPPLPPPNRT